MWGRDGLVVIAPGSGSRVPGTVLCFWIRQCSLTVTIKAHKTLYRLNSVRDYSPKKPYAKDLKNSLPRVCASENEFNRI